MSVGAVRFGPMDAVQFGPWDALGYGRPPVTASFEDLRRRGMPEVYFVHPFLPEGVAICDVDEFAAMVEEAYHSTRILQQDPPDEQGNQLCRSLGHSGYWGSGWGAITPGRRSGWGMTLAPERDGRRQATLNAVTRGRGGRNVVGDVLATFSISTRPAEKSPAESRLPLFPLHGTAYGRPPAAVTVSYDELSRRGLPRMLFVNTRLPEGITVCDINGFVAMIKEARAANWLRFIRPDEQGDGQCVGLGSTGIWEWSIARQSKPINGERYASPCQSICRILFTPEKDGKRTCTVELNGSPGHDPEDEGPIMFTIRVRSMSMVDLEREAATGDPSDVAEGVEMTLSQLADTRPAAAGLLRLLSSLPDLPVPEARLLWVGHSTAQLPGPQAAALIGPLLNNPHAAGEAISALHYQSVVRGARGGVQVHPLARAAIRAQLTAEESAHWQQAGAALVEGALPDDPQEPTSWRVFAHLLRLAQATLELTSDGMERIARYLGESGSHPAARDLWRQIADAHAVDDGYGPEHPRTLAARHETARWTGTAGDAASARDQLTALLTDTERVLGPEHPHTLAARSTLAYWTGKAAG